MSGQGAVGVVVSAVQVLSATASIWGTTPQTFSASPDDGKAEQRSAFIFFVLSTIFFVGTTGALAALTAMPAYKVVIAPLESRQKQLQTDTSDSGERQGLVSTSPVTIVPDGKGQILRIAKANLSYELAVAYVFIVTLVGALNRSTNFR